jgi:hypothetical protein
MVQIVENWALLTCRLEALRRADDLVELDAWIDAADDVAGFRNLLRQHVGTRKRIKLRGAGVQLAPGARFAVKARLADPATAWGDPATLAVLAP